MRHPIENQLYHSRLNLQRELRLRQIGEWYRVPDHVYSALAMHQAGFLNRHLRDQKETLGDLWLMARRPLLDVKGALEAVDWSAPAIRFLLHGLPGVGKSTTLSQLAHLAVEEGWTLLYFANCMRLVRPKQGVALSASHPGRIDTPAESVEWLQLFRTHNAHCIDKLNALTLSRDYEWDKRHTSKAGQPLLSIIDLAVNDPKHASDVMCALVAELKLAASAGQHRMLVLADRANSLWSKSRPLRRKIVERHKDNEELIDAQVLTQVHAARDALANDWTGGHAIATTDGIDKADHQVHTHIVKVAVFLDSAPSPSRRLPSLRLSAPLQSLRLWYIYPQLSVDDYPTYSGPTAASSRLPALRGRIRGPAPIRPGSSPALLLRRGAVLPRLCRRPPTPHRPRGSQSRRPPTTHLHLRIPPTQSGADDCTTLKYLVVFTARQCEPRRFSDFLKADGGKARLLSYLFVSGKCGGSRAVT